MRKRLNLSFFSETLKKERFNRFLTFSEEDLLAILKTTNEYDEELEEEQFEDPSLFRDAIALKDRDGNVISQWLMNLSVQSIDALNLEWCSN